MFSTAYFTMIFLAKPQFFAGIGLKAESSPDLRRGDALTFFKIIPSDLAHACVRIEIKEEPVCRSGIDVPSLAPMTRPEHKLSARAAVMRSYVFPMIMPCENQRSVIRCEKINEL